MIESDIIKGHPKEHPISWHSNDNCQLAEMMVAITTQQLGGQWSFHNDKSYTN